MNKYLIMLILGLILSLFLVLKFQPKIQSKVIDTQMKIDTQFVLKCDTIYIPKLQLKYIKGKTDSFYVADTDTVETLDSFFTPKYYSNSYSFDSSTITINDTVNHNGIVGRSIDAKIAKEIITDSVVITKEIEGKKNKRINRIKGFVVGLLAFIALNKIIK